MRMYQVSKRDGQIAPFNLSKISVAIEKAFKAQDKEYNQDIIDLLALKVTADFFLKLDMNFDYLFRSSYMPV